MKGSFCHTIFFVDETIEDGKSKDESAGNSHASGKDKDGEILLQALKEANQAVPPIAAV